MENNYLKLSDINQAFAEAPWRTEYDPALAKFIVNNLIPADVSPIVHAYWRILRRLKLYTQDNQWYDSEDQCECSNCRAKWDFYSTEKKFDYCFSCGSRMDEEEVSND